MPATSKKQYRYIMYLRNKYGTRAKAPEKDKWIFDTEWTSVNYKSLPEREGSDVGITRYEPILNETITSGMVGEVPETPLKKWQAPIADKIKKKKSGSIKTVQVQGSK